MNTYRNAPQQALRGAIGGLGMILASCSTIPEHQNLEDHSTKALQQYETIGDAVENYSLKKSKQLAADSEREVRCLEDMAGDFYKNEAAFFKDLEQCGHNKQTLDQITYGAAAMVIDGAKVYFLAKGISGLLDDGAAATTNGGGNGPTTGGSFGSGSSGGYGGPVTY